MYRKEIEEYIDSHKDQMIEDICTLCRINSEKMPYTEGKPFGSKGSVTVQPSPAGTISRWARMSSCASLSFKSAVPT